MIIAKSDAITNLNSAINNNIVDKQRYLYINHRER